jgi:thymidylate synthase (FAD)
MKIIEPSYEILEFPSNALEIIERAGRVCYKSEDKIGPGTAESFARGILKRGHESVLEHVSISVRFICDRGVSHELVRHRMAAFSQESTRYCNYGHSGEIAVIKPKFWLEDSAEYGLWSAACVEAESVYLSLMARGASPQEARTVLPNSLKTEVVMTANVREWRHVMKLRTAKAAHPQMRQLMIPLLADFWARMPVLFDDIAVEK